MIFLNFLLYSVFLFITKILKYTGDTSRYMPDKEMTDDDLEDELEKAFKANEAKQDHCGTALPSSREVGVQRTDVKLKEEK